MPGIVITTQTAQGGIVTVERIGAAHLEAYALVYRGSSLFTGGDMGKLRREARDRIICLAERLKIEAAQGYS